MIAPDSGIHVTNYVGTYHIETINKVKYIISEEVRYAIYTNEKELPQKDIFLNDMNKDEYILMKLANVDISKEKSILEFCSTYGLPVSSAKLDDTKPGYYNDNTITNILKYNELLPFNRKDYMPLSEFCIHVSCAKRLLNLKTELEKPKNECDERIILESVLSILLFQFSHGFNFSNKEYLPKTPTFRFQYMFQYILAVIESHNPKTTFHNICIAIINCMDSISIPTIKRMELDPQLLITINSDQWKRCLSFLKRVLADKTLELSVDNYGNIHLSEEFDTSTFKDQMYEIAPIVLCDAINERLQTVSISLTHKDGKYVADWNMNHMIEGITIEMLLLLNTGYLVKKCSNPTCNAFFIPRTHYDKKYCSSSCGNLVAKRKQRQLDKEDPKRTKAQPYLRDRKKENTVQASNETE